MSTLIDDIKTFISTQVKLSNTLLNEFPECTNYLLLFNLPKNGEIEVNEIIWSYKKHGSGVKFIRADDGRLVDICERIDQPELFSEWRLSLYLESIHRKDYNLKGELAILCQSGQVLSSKEHPRLLSLAQ
jgi:hypothetical protein